MVRWCCCCTAFPNRDTAGAPLLPALAAAGYRAVAPDQRGYSPGARPDPADLSNYAFDKLVDDAVEIAAAAGHDGKRFHLVGHDWGGQVSWGVAARIPERLASLTILSRPHPKSFRARSPRKTAIRRTAPSIIAPSSMPDTGKLLLEDNARRLRAGLFGQGVPAAAMEEHLSVLGNPAAMEAALAWYRANKGLAADIGTIEVPTLYIWGDADATVGPDAAHGTRRIRRRGLRHGSAAGRRPFRHGPGAGQGHGTAAGAPQEASGLKDPRVALAAPRESRYHAPPLGNREFLAWLARRSR